MKEKSVVGDLINFRGLVYAPLNENGVIFLFGKVADDLNMYIEEIKPGFPDCIGRRFVGKGWERVSIEFEFESINFKAHSHDAKQCDLIVCWEHNWPECPIEVIELKSEIKVLENPPIAKPTESRDAAQNTIEQLFKSKNTLEKVQQWYSKILEGLQAQNDTIWAKIGNKYIGWYSPERSFASVKVQKSSIQIECFTGNTTIAGTNRTNPRFAPRWAKSWVKSDGDAEKAIAILQESVSRITAAIKAGEPTGYFSGGEPFGLKSETSESDETEE